MDMVGDPFDFFCVFFLFVFFYPSVLEFISDQSSMWRPSPRNVDVSHKALALLLELILKKRKYTGLYLLNLEPWPTSADTTLMLSASD